MFLWIRIQIMYFLRKKLGNAPQGGPKREDSDECFPFDPGMNRAVHTQMDVKHIPCRIKGFILKRVLKIRMNALANVFEIPKFVPKIPTTHTGAHPSPFTVNPFLSGLSLAFGLSPQSRRQGEGRMNPSGGRRAGRLWTMV